ncbi:MAG: hypothetical protein IPH32_02145 [Bacteroidetes bacterium]|nr:hypothetical protein [Bacteroidota bacterium]
MSNPFADKYKTLPTAKLIEIIENSHNYQALAVDAAKLELAGRTDVEIAQQEFKETTSQAQQQEELNQKKRQLIQDKASTIFEYADPFTNKTPEKSIVILCVILSILFLYKTLTSLSFLALMFSDLAEADYSTYWFFIEFFYLPVNIYFLWRKHKIGWYMFLIWLIYQIMMDITYLYMTSQLPDVDSSFSQIIELPSASSYIFKLLIHLAFVYFMVKPSIRNLFQIEKKKKMSAVK